MKIEEVDEPKGSNDLKESEEKAEKRVINEKNEKKKFSL